MPNTHNTKNFFAHGGNELVIGGKLTFLPGAEVENMPDGGAAVTPAAYQAASEATTIAGLKEDFNTLLASLKAAGLVSDTAPEEAQDGDG